MKTITLLIAMMAFSVNVQSQKLELREVPEAVMIAFRKANPGVGNPQWRKEKGCYQAKCLINKTPKTYTFSKLGTPIVNDGKTAVSILPGDIKVYLDKNYPGVQVDKVLKIMKADKSVTYNVEVSGTDLFFDSNGKFLKSKKTT